MKRLLYKKYGFTLAETLITLGIIGVVASLTMPTLIQHHKKVETSSRLKKFYSMMNQAIIMSEADNGSARDWVKAPTQYDSEGDIDYEAQGRVSKEFFMKYLAPYLKYTHITDGENIIDKDGNKSGTATTVYLADGSSFSFHNGYCFDVIFDINGISKGPNQSSRDRFTFLLCQGNYIDSLCLNHYRPFCSYNIDLGKNPSREKRLAKCKNQGAWCSGLLEIDGWEFKDDYPW